MSFVGYKDVIEDGDEIILYVSYNNLLPLKICRNQITQIKHGAIRHRDVLGKKFGSKILTASGKGWVYALQPTPELWTLALPHRTQILYFADISFIIMQLDLKPGSVVVEAGTGSGSLSHSIARTIAPSGHLYTFEFHEQRAEVAAKEFKNHGLEYVVTSACRDVIKDGFDVPVSADAVFLDLPSPWLVIPHAKSILNSCGGRICSFSPCIEQVQRTCDALDSLGFTDVSTVECLMRVYDVRSLASPAPIFGLSSSSKGRDEEKQIIPPEDSSAADNVLIKPEKGEISVDSKDAEKGKKDLADMRMKRPNDENDFGGKRKRGNGDKDVVDSNTNVREDGSSKMTENANKLKTILCSVPKKDSQGHTGYLTFASLFVHS